MRIPWTKQVNNAEVLGKIETNRRLSIRKRELKCLENITKNESLEKLTHRRAYCGQEGQGKSAGNLYLMSVCVNRECAIGGRRLPKMTNAAKDCK